MKKYTLELSHEELVTIRVLVGSVLGSSLHSPRKHADSIYNRACGILGSNDPEDLIEYRLLEGRTIKFDDYPETKTPQQLKIEELEKTINEAQKQLVDANQQLEELKGM